VPFFLTCYVQEAQTLVSLSLNYTQVSYGREGSHNGTSSHISVIGFGRGLGDGWFANFQCYICLKFGYTTNVCHFRYDVSYQPHESLCFINLATQQCIPYSASSYKTSNTLG